MSNIHCPMIHGGLHINFKYNDGNLGVNQCCLSSAPLQSIVETKIWDNKNFIEIRQKNNENIWNLDCWPCQRIENSGSKSFRQAMLQHYGERHNLSGPVRIDFLFDRSCNLACTICSPHSSTLWQKYVQDNKIDYPKFNNTSNIDQVIALLKTLDLSNLEQAQFCGGETLLGTTYWKLAEALADLVPNARKKLLVGFQTNGTQSIDLKYHELIEKFKLVKLMISIDGIGNRFDYLRWPGNWNQVSENLLNLKENLPVNVMFLVQETLSNFNLYYAGEVKQWISNYFPSNRLGDPTDHSYQLVHHNNLGIDVITQEYADSIKNQFTGQMLPSQWKENPQKIIEMLKFTATHDNIRKQNWKIVFPEIVPYYSRYLQ